MNEVLYNAYVKILKEELLPAMGCTEPIAVAYAAALVRKTLGTIPQSAEVHVSANIIKNVKSVVVPHTGGMRGIDAAVAAGIIAGNADRELEVLSDVNEEEVRIMAHYLKQTPISIAASDNGYIFDIQIRVANRAKAMAAAGSDARMSGCERPVVINSGSGNQGMTASLPVIVYAKELKTSQSQLYRALVVSNLVTIHLKTGIGRLSAYCGATSAGCGAGAGITYLYGGKANEISHTIVNAVAINSGMVCDGAKASCAAKIASAVEAGLLGMQMQMQGEQFYGGDGIVVKGVENTIRNVGRLARFGMAETDREIIDMMVSSQPQRC